MARMRTLMAAVLSLALLWGSGCIVVRPAEKKSKPQLAAIKAELAELKKELDALKAELTAGREPPQVLEPIEAIEEEPTEPAP